MLFQIKDIPPAAMAVAVAVLVIVAFGAGKLCSKQAVAPEGSEEGGAGKAETSENPVANAVAASQDPQQSLAAKARADGQLEENPYGEDVMAL